MKILIAFQICFFLSIFSYANDILILVNKKDGSAGMKFSGQIKKIKNCNIVFKTEEDKYVIPTHDIYSIEFEDPDNIILLQYQYGYSSDNCMKGMNDAQMFHKGGGAFALGILFGPFAVIGAAVSNPSPMGGQSAYMSQNKDLFGDSTYLNCYSRAARQKNTKNAALGWLSWVVLILVAVSGTA